MRLESLTVRALGPIKGTWALDLTQVPGTIVAIHGENAIGKTSMLEAFVAAISPKLATPSRGPLKNLAVSRDTLVQAAVVNGSAYTIRHLFDSVSGKTESSVTGEDGKPVLKSTQVSKFKPWAAKHMPDPDVVVASLFGAQRQSKLIEATDGERKAIILRSLGLERYERLAKGARTHAKEISDELSTIVARLDELGVVDVAAAELAVETAVVGAKSADEALAAVRRQLEQAKSLIAEAERAAERRRAQEARRTELGQRIEKAHLDVTAAEAQLGQARAEVADIDMRIATNRKAIAERPQIEDAVQRRNQIDTELTELGEQLRSLQAESESLRKEQARLERDADSTTRRAAQQKQRLPRLQQAVESSQRGGDAATTLPGLRQELEEERKELERLSAELAALEAQREAARGEQSAAQDRETRAKADAEACRNRAEKARERVNKLHQDVKRAQKGAAAVEQLPAREADLEAAKAEQTAAEQGLERLRGEQLIGADERITWLRTGLDWIADPVTEAGAAALRERAVDTLRNDDSAAEKAKARPKALQAAQDRVSETRRLVGDAEVALRACAELAALAGRLEADRKALAEAEAEIERETRSAAEFVHAAEIEAETQRTQRIDIAELVWGIETVEERVSTAREQVEESEQEVTSCAELAALAGRLDADREALAEAQAQIAADEASATELLAKAERCKAELVRSSDRREDLARRRENLDEERERVSPLATKAPRLASAEERIAELNQQRGGADARVTEAEKRLDAARSAARDLQGQLTATPEPEATPSAPTAREVATLQERVEASDKASRDAHGAVSVAEKALEDARGAAERASALTDQRRHLESELADWTLLSVDLGRNGLQADEIDCAGPELTTVVNELLHSCLGTRYTLRFETTRMDAKGRRELEGLPIIMTDTVNGYEGDVRNGSGGEYSLLGDVISLAVAVTSVLQSGIERPTLIRDEPGAALSAENRRVYMTMLRKAAEMIKADKVLIVSHADDMIEMADSRLEFTREGIRLH